AVLPDVAALVGSQRFQPEGREQLLLDGANHRLALLRVEQRERKREREELVRAERRISYDVVEMSALRVPERLLEGGADAVRIRRVHGRSLRIAQLATPERHQAERVVPEGIDLDGLAVPRRDHAVADARVHPGELDAWGTRGEQS